MARKDATTLVAMLEGALGHYVLFFFSSRFFALAVAWGMSSMGERIHFG